MPPEAASLTGLAPSLADFTQPALIVPQLRERDTAGIISELSHVLHRQGCVPDVLSLYQTALNQQLLANSALECGIAVPHARLAGVKQVQFAFGRAREPIAWDGKSSRPVCLVFLLAVPATDATRYLHVLATLAKLGQPGDLLDGLRQAADAEAIYRHLGKIQLRREPRC